MTRRKPTEKQLDRVIDEITDDHVRALDERGWMIVPKPEFDDGQKWPWCRNGSWHGPIPSWCDDIEDPSFRKEHENRIWVLREPPPSGSKVESTVVNFPPKGEDGD